MPKFLNTGDFIVSDDYKGKDLIDESVTKLFSDADYRIIDHEAPITSDYLKIRYKKQGCI